MEEYSLKDSIMSLTKGTFLTISSVSVPLFLQESTPIFAGITAIIGTVFIFFKCWNEIHLWRMNIKKKKDS